MRDVLMRVRALAVAAALNAVCVNPLLADVDMTGRWTDYVPEFGLVLCNDYIQSGTTLTWTPCDMSSSTTGTINPMTGAFSFVSPPTFCPPYPATDLQAVVAADGQSYTGTLTVRITPASCLFGLTTNVSGVRGHCGDFYVDPDNGEQCDDGNNIDGDCCSATCQQDANGAPCSSDGNVCTDDQCVAGSCQHLTNTAPCDDGDACTTDDQCAAGSCIGTGSCALDHYKCYQGTDLKIPKFVPVVADTADQLGNGVVSVQKLKFVCTPVDKNGEGITDPSAYLACYQVAGADLSPSPSVEVSTQFQSSRFQLKKPKLLCTPATMTLLP